MKDHLEFQIFLNKRMEANEFNTSDGIILCSYSVINLVFGIKTRPLSAVPSLELP